MEGWSRIAIVTGTEKKTHKKYFIQKQGFPKTNEMKKIRKYHMISTLWPAYQYHYKEFNQNKFLKTYSYYSTNRNQFE